MTLRLLLCHRAGMVPHGFLGRSDSKAPPTLLEVLNKRNALADWLTGNYLGSVKVKYPPDTEFRYSGGGYCVVQKVVEDVTGEPFDVAMSKTLLEPLQMNRSHFHQPPREQETDNTARGYGCIKTIAYGERWGVLRKSRGGFVDHAPRPRQDDHRSPESQGGPDVQPSPRSPRNS